MKLLRRKINVKLQYIRMALHNIKRPHLGDIVKYYSTECCLIQGVQSPYWDLLPLTEENLAKEKRHICKRIHENDFKLQKTIKRYIFSFLSTYKFLMDNWYTIDIYKTGRISYSSLNK